MEWEEEGNGEGVRNQKCSSNGFPTDSIEQVADDKSVSFKMKISLKRGPAAINHHEKEVFMMSELQFFGGDL